WPSAVERATLSSRVLDWHQSVATVHAATLVVALALTIIVVARGAERPSRYIGPATALTYLLHAAVIVGVDQLTITSVTPYIGYCLGIAGVTVLTPTTAFAVYAAALATYIAGI